MAMPHGSPLDGAPRLFALVTDPDGPDAAPVVIAWGHELPDRAVVSWRLNGGSGQVGQFSSAQRAADTLSSIEPVRVVWTA
jgi:hypothetical protein